MNYLYFTYTLNGLLMIAMPIALAVYLTRHFRTGWRLVWIGVVTFIFSQIGHIPFNFLLTALFKNGTLPTPPEEYVLIFNAIVLGLSAGLWEECARYLMYRWWAKDARSWGKGLVLGAGWGGIESFILGLVFLFTLGQMIVLRNADLTTLIPAEQLALAQQQVDVFWSQPWFASILGAMERAFAICFHLSASVLILQAFRRKQIRWLVLAVLWHTVFNSIALFSAGTWGPYVAEIFIGVMAIISLGIVFALKEPEPEIKAGETEGPPPVKDADSIMSDKESQILEEILEKSRYN
jgi:uncharacterized membrane protein YhfC